MLLSVFSVEFYSGNSSHFRSVPLSPKAKYVLARFALCFQEGTCRHERGELAALLGISKGRLSDALHELVERGLLLSHPQRGRRGRPNNHYSLTQETWQLLQSAQSSDMVAGDLHWRAIEKVMTAAPATEASAAQGEGAESLPLESRLLLCALLCHADRHGVVQGLSITDLYKLTGLRSAPLKDRLQRFVNLELIRAWIPGVTSHALFGKAKSVYYLNLQHPIFGSCYPLAGIMIFGWVQKFEAADRLHEWLVKGWKDLARRKPPEDDGKRERSLQGHVYDEAARVAAAASQPESPRIIPALQVRLEIYASWLLSRYWGALEADRDLSCPLALEAIIRQDFVDVRKKAKAELVSVADLKVQVIYTHAYWLARQTQRYLRQTASSEELPKITYQEHDYLILPHDPSPTRWEGRPGDRWARTVLIFSKGASVWHGCYNAMTAKLYGHESEIPLQARYLSGLLTKPSGKASSS